MTVKIENKLTTDDISVLVDGFRDSYLHSLNLFAGFDLDFIKIFPLTISIENSGYIIKCEILLQDPIGLTACIGLRIEQQYILAHSKEIRLHIHKPQLNVQEIEKDIGVSLELLEHVANYSCEWHEVSWDEYFVVDSKDLRNQIELQIKKERMVKRGEVARPFETIHAESSRDAKKLAGDLVPLYVDYDKWDLFGVKKVYRYLPRSLVMKLLRCDCTNLMPEDLFEAEERKILEDLVVRGYLKKRRVAGKGYYLDLNEKTRRHFLSILKQK